MSTWDDKPNDYEHALAEIEKWRAAYWELNDRCNLAGEQVSDADARSAHRDD